MKREINGRVYDTAAATVIVSYGSDSTHVHRTTSLYQSRDGEFFIVEEQEVHGVDRALLIPMTSAMACEWLKNHGNKELAQSLFNREPETPDLELDSTLKQRVRTAAAVAGLTDRQWIIHAINAALDVSLAHHARSAVNEQITDAGVGS